MSELLLLSGLLSDDTPWIDVATRLSAACPVRIVSFANCSSLGDMAERVLLKAPERFALAGHSMGGRVALEVWRRAPERITALGLLNTGAFPRRPEETASRANDRLGSIASIPQCAREVRFTPDNGHASTRATLSANKSRVNPKDDTALI